MSDIVYTPHWCALDMILHFKPVGKVLDPCSGKGVFYDLLDGEKDFCEISHGKDFFNYFEKADWIISNPPYTQLRQFSAKAITLADHIVWLIPTQRYFNAWGFIKMMRQYGELKEMRFYGGGGKLGFPMGNAVSAMYWAKGWRGKTLISYYENQGL
jgi:hypothetical protein